MVEELTLILILHNRHDNLDRLLLYYYNCDFPIIIADSSDIKHIFLQEKKNWLHCYTPGLSFTQKIEKVLHKVNTPYVALCADDDFILPKALQQCVSFLKRNNSYSIVQGLAIRYYKETIKTGKIRYGLLYDNSTDIEETVPLERLVKMFYNYRSVLYAVFRTEILKKSFDGAGAIIKNLFLNEYITAFIPIIFGKYKELPILYQVREYAENSDDKTAKNIDTMSDDITHSNELHTFKEFILNKIISILHNDRNKMNEVFDLILTSFSIQLQANRDQKNSFKKRIGNMIGKIPFLGNKIISKNRKIESDKQLNTIIKTQDEKEEITKISNLLLRFR